MTAEIVIMNKLAIAMAADSAVTMQREAGQKIYNTVNKLFALSKYQPVGIMVYGNAEFMAIPWEAIIKTYRHRLGETTFDRLEDYAQDFLSFFTDDTGLFPESEHARFFREQLSGYQWLIRGDVDTRVRSTIDSQGSISHEEVRDIVSEVVRSHADAWEGLDDLPIPDEARATLEAYDEHIEAARDDVLEHLEVSDDTYLTIKALAHNLFTKDRFPADTSGVVIAGFGQADRFPTLYSYELESLVAGWLKCAERGSSAITLENTAAITPFAQFEMVFTFMEGIDPELRQAYGGYVSQLLTDYPEELIKQRNLSSPVRQLVDRFSDSPPLSRRVD